MVKINIKKKQIVNIIDRLRQEFNNEKYKYQTKYFQRMIESNV